MRKTLFIEQNARNENSFQTETYTTLPDKHCRVFLVPRIR